MYGRNFGRVAPVKVGDELDVKIEGIGEKGDGIARVEGFVIFVPGVKQGDEVRIRVTRVLRRVGFGEVISEQQTEEKTEQPEETEEAEPVEDTEDFGEDLELEE